MLAEQYAWAAGSNDLTPPEELERSGAGVGSAAHGEKLFQARADRPALGSGNAVGPSASSRAGATYSSSSNTEGSGSVELTATSCPRPCSVAQCSATGSLAALACFHADPTVFVVCSVTMAFCPARGASARTGIDLSADQVGIALHQSRQHSRGDAADIRTVGVETDAATKRVHVFFR
jgi:hypothetical protein